ncbi:MAG TPA: hypothetical protein VG893_01915 [Terracidiphilus sp.]|nr:hypothetical protein [Terracidiphilus sp.]
MNRRRWMVAAALLAVLAAPHAYVEACGPFFEPEVFVNAAMPDDLAVFARGHLGILQAGYDSDEYAVAYRYLQGGRLSAAEQAAVKPHASSDDDFTSSQWQAKIAAEKEAQPAHQWLTARGQYAPDDEPAAQKPAFPTDYQGMIEFDPNYLNCPDAAFTTAVQTLNRRAAAWGAKSPWLADWIHGQDAVFSNCSGKGATMPATAPGDAPALLKADREYQLAATAFYAHEYDDAARRFGAIAAEKDSPWQAWGGYLAARALVRQAFALGKPTDPYGGELATYDAATMQRAQQTLETLLTQPRPMPSREIVESELNFIRIRTEPEKRAAEISAALAGPGPDANFRQDLADLSWLLMKQMAQKNLPPLMQWIAAWRGAKGVALAEWQQTHALPWLVAALAQADANDAATAELLAAADAVKPGTPAYDTVFYHKVRLLTAMGRADEVRTLLDAALPALEKQKPDSKLNALRGERLAVARNFDEFLTYAPRTVLTAGSEGAGDLQQTCSERAHAVNAPAPCPEAEHPLEFDRDGTEVLNRHLPLAMLIEAAQSTKLPENMRRQIATMAWTRAVLLEDAASAAKLVPLAPKAIRDGAGTSVGFPALLTILRNAGIRPYLEPGIPRVASFSTFDELRDNWWCKPWDAEIGGDGKPKPPSPAPAFLSAQQSAAGNAEYAKLQEMPDSVNVIGQRVLEYAAAHPDDGQAPEALALTVRAGHYACQDWRNYGMDNGKSEYTAVSKAAFQLLHKRYPNSPWTRKTPYYY